MQVKSGVEQALSILTILATQQSDEIVTSDTISNRLGVSPTFLKKIMRKLVVSQIITSTPGKNGGFQLQKSVDVITLRQVFEAIEGQTPFLKVNHLVQHIFNEPEKVATGEQLVIEAFTIAEQVYREQLEQTTLADVLYNAFKTEDIQQYNWNAHQR